MAEPVTTTDLGHLRGNPYAERSWVPRLVDAIDLRDRIIGRLDDGWVACPGEQLWRMVDHAGDDDCEPESMAPDEVAYFEARRASDG